MKKLFKTKKKDGPDEDLQLLAKWMAGAFSNQAQARKAQTYDYTYLYIMPIWKEKTDGFWFYVEQVMADQNDQPFRQSVYHLDRVNKDLLEYRIYSIHNETQFARSYEKPELLNKLTPDMIMIRSGCSVILRRLNEESFAGSTLGEGCPSEIRGALYTTSQVVINEHQMINWDRGYDRGGKQVWGATMGGFIFAKLNSYEV